MSAIALPKTEQQSKAVITLLIGVVIVIVLIIASKKIFRFLGLSENADVTKTKRDAQRAFDKSAAQILQQQQPTFTDANLKTIADTIHNDLKYSSLDDNKLDAKQQLMKMHNDADVIRLISLFGTRNEYFFGIPMGSFTLAEFITSNLSSGSVSEINNNYAGKGIKYRF